MDTRSLCFSFFNGKKLLLLSLFQINLLKKISSKLMRDALITDPFITVEKFQLLFKINCRKCCRANGEGGRLPHGLENKQIKSITLGFVSVTFSMPETNHCQGPSWRLLKKGCPKMQKEVSVCYIFGTSRNGILFLTITF